MPLQHCRRCWSPLQMLYYNVLGPMPIGLIAALPMLAAAVWLTLREMKQEEKN